MLGVDVLDVTGDAQDFIDEYRLSYPMLKDKDGDATRELRRGRSSPRPS